MAEETKKMETTEDQNKETKEETVKESKKKIDVKEAVDTGLTMAKKGGKLLLKGAAFAAGVLGTAFAAGLAIGMTKGHGDDDDHEDSGSSDPDPVETSDNE